MAAQLVATSPRAARRIEARSILVADPAEPRPAAAADAATQTATVTPTASPPQVRPNLLSPAPSPAPPAPAVLAPAAAFTRPVRPVRDSTAESLGGVHIGHLEVRIIPPPAPQTRPPMRRTSPHRPSAPLARGFRSFGLAQA
jgi:hypothetical protein